MVRKRILDIMIPVRISLLHEYVLVESLVDFSSLHESILFEYLVYFSSLNPHYASLF